jgi:signal transduction histidine kinase
MEMETIRDRLASRRNVPSEKVLAAGKLLGQAIQEGRRLVSELRPLIIDEEGVLGAVEYLVSEEKAQEGLDISFDHKVEFRRLPPLLEGTMFRIVQEALNNVKRHSRADRAEVRFRQVGDRVEIEVRDRGVGFDPSQVPDQRFGLRGIQERARLFKGKAIIESSPGEGTRIFVELPLGAAGSLAGGTPSPGDAPPMTDS